MTRFEWTGDEEYPGGGEWVLLDNGLVQLMPSPELRTRVEEMAEGVGDAALKWGASLVVGLAGLGAFLYLRGKRPAGWALFGLSGAAGLLAGAVRGGALRIDQAMFGPHPARITDLKHLENGGIAIGVKSETSLPPWTITLSPDQFDRGEAERFVQAVDMFKGA